MRHPEQLTNHQRQALIDRFDSILKEGYYNEILMTMNIIQQQMLEWERIEGINIHASMYNHSLYEILSLLEVPFLPEKQ